MQYSPTIITFSHLRWDFVYQRPQHLLSRLVKSHQVILIEEPVRAKSVAEWQFARPEKNVLVCRPHTPVEAQGFCDEQFPFLDGLVRGLIEREKVRDYVLWFYTPMALPLMQSLEPKAVIYDCMDELSAFYNAPPQLLRRESELLEAADVVFTGGPSLYGAKKDRHSSAHCFPSSVDAAHFAAAANGMSEAGDQANGSRSTISFSRDATASGSITTPTTPSSRARERRKRSGRATRGARPSRARDGSRRPDRRRWGLFNGRSCFHIPGHVDDGNVFVAVQGHEGGEHFGPLVVREVLIPSALDQLREHAGDAAVRMLLGELAQVRQYWADDHPVGRLDDDELGTGRLACSADPSAQSRHCAASVSAFSPESMCSAWTRSEIVIAKRRAFLATRSSRYGNDHQRRGEIRHH